ncbi:MAG: sodium:solute symporter [Hyphomicrobiaceae bacterium]|nr:sodium:solute symporter [Hyphomicrobiaceae bacterium]MCC0009746.1 sodium:solute symporter [Hyphomicrobiaceae bacterium]
MNYTHHTRRVNPRLGTYFGIFASALSAVFFLAAIFEQLGVSDQVIRWMMLLGPVLLYGAIGVASATRQPLDYFAAGRRVPAIIAGLALAITALGGTGLVSLTGAFFVSGFDALAITIGGLAGFVLMAILLAPFLRKFGAYSVPTFLGRRFESRLIRLVSALLLAVPMLLLIVAELKIVSAIGSWLTSTPQPLLIVIFSGIALVTVVLGGMRGLSWSNAAQAITVLFAFLVPAAMVAVIVTKLPIPQLSYGPIVRSLLKQESALSLPSVAAQPFAFSLPDAGFATIAKPFATPFGAIGPAAFVITMVIVMTGLAAAPWLLPRVSTTPGVHETRKSLGWATFVFGVLVLTMTSVAAFLRAPLMEFVLASKPGQLPDWITVLQTYGLVEIQADTTRMTLGSIAFARDGVFLALPIATGLPSAFVYLAAASAIAAALASIGAAAVALGNVISEDIINGFSWEPRSDTVRLTLARTMLAVGLGGGMVLALALPADPLKLLLWAITITGATAFPTLVLSIWWKRINGFGALAGMLAGFTIATVAISASAVGLIGVADIVAAGVALPVGTIAALLVSALTPAPSRHALELVRDIRVPGGQILYDREMQRLRLKQRRSAT